MVLNLSGQTTSTISGNDVSFNEEFNGDVQAEPADWVEPDTVGLGAGIGIREGKPFTPNARMKGVTSWAATPEASASPP